MPRNDDVRKRLQWAALELFRKHGYEETTAAQIAAEAGVTERTFFRYFPDKREVLFDGDAAFSEMLSSAVRNAPAALGPWDTLHFAFNTVKHLFIENRPFTEPRRDVIANNPALQERATAKSKMITSVLASGLCERGLPAPQANLAAQIGMATLSHGVANWFNDGSIDLEEHIANAFREASELSSSKLASKQPKQRKLNPPKRSGKALK